ncbi:hypothetical protein NHX12_005846 [Muraenolepis orangiensis]|uniref:Uncharacterized protein n=1 Tax=Muraenolepis orangiensis TaxID=630683 RepID=A0A9Q0DSC5_9TELE|nr:hypothetical protein NHX12_005846 [Muraenolepis orangiensis]
MWEVFLYSEARSAIGVPRMRRDGDRARQRSLVDLRGRLGDGRECDAIPEQSAQPPHDCWAKTLWQRPSPEPQRGGEGATVNGNHIDPGPGSYARPAHKTHANKHDRPELIEGRLRAEQEAAGTMACVVPGNHAAAGTMACVVPGNHAAAGTMACVVPGDHAAAGTMACVVPGDHAAAGTMACVVPGNHAAAGTMACVVPGNHASASLHPDVFLSL